MTHDEALRNAVRLCVSDGTPLEQAAEVFGLTVAEVEALVAGAGPSDTIEQRGAGG